MGQSLPKPVTSVVVKRVDGTAFRVGFAEMTGWRQSMEDAHVIYAQDTWGFFGVFDGHGGDQCSCFIARRISEELVQSGMPEDDVAVTAYAQRLEKESLDSNQPSGSTGTFVIVKAPSTPGGNYHLRVGNIGDSRFLLGRADGSIFPGPGTDNGLTTDHKPDLASERERIERTGGNVQEVMGVARVNGDLAVSRAFGDAQHKTTGGPEPQDHPVCAAPELKEFECGPTDFLMLVCDGISEGSFPNEAVVKLAAEKLKSEEGKPVDPAQAAIAVCHEAIKMGSKKNLSCMIVLLGGGEVPGETVEFIPGPFEAPENGAFRKAYAAMAEHAGSTLAQALEKRFSNCRAELAEADPNSEGAKDLQAEMGQYGSGPPEDLPEGSAERINWFDNWLESRNSSENQAGLGDGAEPDGGSGGMTRDQLWEMNQNNPSFKTDRQIGGSWTAENQRQRELVPWMEEGAQPHGVELDTTGYRIGAFDQFSENEQKFAYRSTFKEDLSQYSTPLNPNNVPPHVRAKAERMERQSKMGRNWNLRCDEEAQSSVGNREPAAAQGHEEAEGEGDAIRSQASEKEEVDEDDEEEPPVPKGSMISQEAMGRLNPVADTGLALGIGMDVEEGTHQKTSPDSSVRKGTGFVAMQNLPESEGDEEIQEAPSRATGRKVSFSQEGGQDSERTRAMRQGTGFVAMRDLPESDEEDEGDEYDETQAQSASSERKVSFSEAAGTDSEKAQAMRKGTGFVPMSAIAQLGSDEDIADKEVDEIRHVSFSADTATSSDKFDNNKSNRKGTGYMQISELPDDEDEEEDEAADKRVSFETADVRVRATRLEAKGKAQARSAVLACFAWCQQ